MAYATQEEFRLSIRHPPWTGEQQAQAQLALDLAAGVIEDETGQSLELAEETVTLDGPGPDDRWWEVGLGCRKLVLPRWPVTAVASVTLTKDDTELAQGTEGYTWSRAGILTRSGGWWPVGDQVVEVTYTAGHNPIPAGVKRIALRVAAAGWHNPELLSSFSLGDLSKSWAADSGTLTPADIRTLGLYRART